METEVQTPEAETENENEEQVELAGKPVEASAGTKTGRKDEEGNDEKVEASIEIFPGDDLTSAVEMYGEDTVYDDYLRSVTRRAQNAVRSSLNKHLENGVAPEEVPNAVANELADWRPDSDRRPSRKSPEENILSNFSSLPPEKRQEILARLQAAASENGNE